MADRDIEHPADEVDDYADMIMTDEEVRAIIAGFEKQFGMTSEEFLRQRKAGTEPDTWETNAWLSLLEWI
jgi:hypothetical protein